MPPLVPVLLQGLVAGLAATLVMTLFEAGLWWRWGLQGVLDWQQNQVLAARMLAGSPEDHYVSGWILHHVHGGAAGAVFAGAMAILAVPGPVWVWGPVFGMLLWPTAVAIHRLITGVDPFDHPLGRVPVWTALASHLVYGAALGVILFLV